MLKPKAILLTAGAVLGLLVLISACRYPGLYQPGAQVTVEVSTQAAPAPGLPQAFASPVAAPPTTPALLLPPEATPNTPVFPSATASPASAIALTWTPQPSMATGTGHSPGVPNTGQPPAQAGLNPAFEFKELTFVSIRPVLPILVTTALAARPFIYLQHTPSGIKSNPTNPAFFSPGETLLVQGIHFPANANLPVGLYFEKGTRCIPVEGVIVHTSQQGAFSLSFQLAETLAGGQYAVIPILYAEQTYITWSMGYTEFKLRGLEAMHTTEPPPLKVTEKQLPGFKTPQKPIQKETQKSLSLPGTETPTTQAAEK